VNFVLTHSIPRSISVRQRDLEDQRLVVEVVPARICICELPTVEEPILRDEVVITEADDEVFVPRVIRVDGDHGDGFPLLVLSTLSASPRGRRGEVYEGPAKVTAHLE
jgi:hypothetical protein